MLPNPYKSVDPAPSTSKMEVEDLEKILLDETLPLFQRYRAMFSLRNIGTTEAVKALAKGNKNVQYLNRFIGRMCLVKIKEYFKSDWCKEKLIKENYIQCTHFVFIGLCI